MIDGLKVKIKDLDPSLWLDHTEGLDFAASVSTKTGEVFTDKPRVADCQGLTFKLTPTQKDHDKFTAHFQGSLHKFKNGGASNSDDFTLSDIAQTITHLEAVYHIQPSKAIFENIEFGVNVKLPYSCQILLNSLISSSNKRFVELKFKGVQNGKRLSHEQFELKVYDKGKLETGKASNLLRVEMRVKKMQFLKNAVTTLDDLTDKDKLLQLGQILVKRLESVVMYGLPFGDIVKYDVPTQIKLYQWTNANYWSNLTAVQRHREQKAFNDFQEKTGANAMKSLLIQSVAQKWHELLNQVPNYRALEKRESIVIGEPLKAVSLRVNELKEWDELLHDTLSVSNPLKAVLQEESPLKAVYEMNLPHLAASDVKAVLNEGELKAVLQEESPLKAVYEMNLPTFGDISSVQPNKTALETNLPHLAASDVKAVLNEGELKAVSLNESPLCNDFTIKINSKFITKQQQQNFAENQPSQTVKCCDNCGVSIAHKRPQSVYCSTKCKNAALNRKHNIKRSKRPPTPVVMEAITEPKTVQIVAPILTQKPTAVYNAESVSDLMRKLVQTWRM